ncbi:MAG: dockerin type I repeat-containing protein [Candidatus Zixiibacteriota bacterium]|nr:MAG: dockerin type I repeat-containing protein [candidate division Zixibacteria bacterium]
MKKYALLLVIGILLWGLTSVAEPLCPEQPNDNGVCDTLYIERYDTLHYSPGPWRIRFPIMVTNDIPDPATDSISGMVISLCFTSSNPTANPRVEASNNHTNVFPQPDLEGSIFRHLPSMDDPQEHNWMMDLAEQGLGQEWDTRIMDLGAGTHYWLALVPTGGPDQRFPGGSQVLVATMTFTVDDTTTLCIDSCFWPPTGSFVFSRSDAVTYIPRHNMPFCTSVRYEEGSGQDPSDNGDCDSFHVEVYPPDRYHLSFPAQVRLPMYVTNDIPDPYIDSIAGMIVPLAFTSSNPAANALINPDHNNTYLQPFPYVDNSIFRHLPSMQYPQERNWMMDLSEQFMGLDWDTRILDLGGGTHFWMSLVPSHTLDQRFPGGSRVLTATMTFSLEDSTTICIDLDLWPPDPWYSVRFSRSDAVTYCPQYTLPYCATIELSDRGDATGDGVVNIADVMYMINYLYRSGPPPASFEAGDANCDDDHSLLDIVFLINYLYKGGPPPGCP